MLLLIVISTALLKLKVMFVLGVDGSVAPTELDTTLPEDPSNPDAFSMPTELNPEIVNVVVIPSMVCVTLSPLSIGVADAASQSNVVCAFKVAKIKKAIIKVILLFIIF